jgi:3-deoxy-D-arabino-heptulosonate 7-phosphate (DAHP) synthase
MTWDCVNNSCGKMEKSTRGFIEADIMVRGGQQYSNFQQDPLVQVQAYLASSMDTLTE